MYITIYIIANTFKIRVRLDKMCPTRWSVPHSSYDEYASNNIKTVFLINTLFQKQNDCYALIKFGRRSPQIIRNLEIIEIKTKRQHQIIAEPTQSENLYSKRIGLRDFSASAVQIRV